MNKRGMGSSLFCATQRSVSLAPVHQKGIRNTNIYIPEFFNTGLAKIRAHFPTWQLKAIKSVQRPIKKPISDAER